MNKQLVLFPDIEKQSTQPVTQNVQEQQPEVSRPSVEYDLPKYDPNARTDKTDKLRLDTGGQSGAEQLGRPLTREEIGKLGVESARRELENSTLIPNDDRREATQYRKRVIPGSQGSVG
jgi:hypothetical protein